MAKKSASTGAGKKPAAAPAATRSTRPTATRTSGVRNSPVPKVTAAAVAPVRREITREMIATRAFEIYQSGTGGSELENWLRAERELKGQGA